jgi:EAL and modified HD-GYP domain-containing signal transduction protein
VDVLLARQSIYDSRIRVIGYELLFRPQSSAQNDHKSGVAASAAVSSHAMLDIGFDKLVGEKLAFINASESFFTQCHYLTLPADKVVLEVLEEVRPEQEVIDAVRQASRLGYRVALDDFIYDPSLEPLLAIANIVKVDVRQLSRGEYCSYPTKLRRPGLAMLAEKVETHEEFDACVAAGYDLFQGYFFCKPVIIRGRHAVPDHVGLLHLLGRLNHPEVEISEVESLISSNPVLGYKLLVYANSAFAGAARKVESIRHAVVMLGLQRVRNAVLLLLLSGFRDKPRELAIIGFVRARMCQLLAEQCGSSDDGQFLTVGLLSVLDAMLDTSMDELLSAVSLPAQVSDALLNGRGPAGRALRICRACESGEWDRIEGDPLTAEAIQLAYVRSLTWAAEMERLLQSDGR